MRHLDGVWGLSRDVNYNTRVVGMRWVCGTERDGGREAGGVFHSRFVVLSTGFASKAYVLLYQGIKLFKGELHHSGHWPQGWVDLKGKRVAVIGTRASGVQLIQNAGREAERLTVFQRTPK